MFVPEKTVKTCQKFRQGWSRIMTAFSAGGRGPLVQLSDRRVPFLFLDEVAIRCLSDLQPASAGFGSWADLDDIRPLHLSRACPESLWGVSGV
jgi:hypothetical protein